MYTYVKLTTVYLASLSSVTKHVWCQITLHLVPSPPLLSGSFMNARLAVSTDLVVI